MSDGKVQVVRCELAVGGQNLGGRRAASEMGHLRLLTRFFCFLKNLLTEYYWKFCECDPWAEGQPLDRCGHSEEQTDDSRHLGSRAAGHQNGCLPKNDPV